MSLGRLVRPHLESYRTLLSHRCQGTALQCGCSELSSHLRSRHLFVGLSGMRAHPGLPPLLLCVFQAFGAAGLSSNYPLAQFFAGARALRFADGPDEVHRAAVAKMELKHHS